MGSYVSNLYEDLRAVEETLDNESVDSYTWEKASDRQRELKKRIRAAEAGEDSE